METQPTCVIVQILLCALIATCIGEVEPTNACPEKCTCSVAMDDVQCHNVDGFPVFPYRDKVRSLVISNHSITAINFGDFLNFSRLSQLTLTKGHIETLTSESFAELKDTLIHVDLSSNRIERLQQTFVNFTKLREVVLNFNALWRLEPGTFVNLSQFDTLRIEYNNLAEIQEGAFSQLPVLQVVTLYNNKLTAVPWRALSALPALQALHVRKNRVSEVGGGAGVWLPQLHDLALEDNPIHSLVGFPNVSLNLTTLNIGFSQLETVSDLAWSSVPQLKQLYMDGTQFYELTNGMFHGLANLDALYMTDMDNLRIVGPNAFAGLDSVHTIDLSRNKKLTEISEDAFADTKQLHRLVLSSGGFTKLSQGMFTGLTNVQDLYLNHMNGLVSVGDHAFSGLDSIRTIDLSANKKLANIHIYAFADIPNLNTIYLNNCSLQTFPDKLLPWYRLSHLRIAYNPLNCDCSVKWMKNRTLFISPNTDLSSLKCASPARLAGRKLMSVEPEYLVCSASMDRKSRFVTAVVVAMVVFVLMTTFALLFKFRHRLASAVRRHFQYRRYKNDMIFVVEHDTSVAELDDGPEGKPLKDMRLEHVPLDEEDS